MLRTYAAPMAALLKKQKPLLVASGCSGELSDYHITYLTAPKGPQ